MDHTWRETEQLVGQKDAEIAEQKQKMEEMAHEFGDMLKVCIEFQTFFFYFIIHCFFFLFSLFVSHVYASSFFLSL